MYLSSYSENTRKIEFKIVLIYIKMVVFRNQIEFETTDARTITL